MSNMYRIVEDLCRSNGTNLTAMCKSTGIPRSIFSELKAGRTKQLSNKYLPMVANHFGVTVDYLLGNEEKENTPTFNKKDERDIAKDLERLRTNLESGEGLMFDGDPLSDEAKESILAAMEIGLKMAKAKNKEKYTPKKYRKDAVND